MTISIIKIVVATCVAAIVLSGVASGSTGFLNLSMPDLSPYATTANLLATNASMKTYVDNKPVINASYLTSGSLSGYQTIANDSVADDAMNVSIKSYVDLSNTSMKNYVDGKPKSGYTISFGRNSDNMVDSQDIFMGGSSELPLDYWETSAMPFPKSGVIRSAVIHAFSLSYGSAESWPCYISNSWGEYNYGESTYINTVASPVVFRLWENYTLNKPVNQGSSFVIHCANPNWTTNPENIRFMGSLYVETEE